MRSIAIEDASQVAEARRIAVSLSGGLGFDEGAAGRVAIVVVELATNLLKHGGGGELLVGAFDDVSGVGLECIALDRGPGVADVTASMRDGYSTAGSAGTGLGAIARQSDLVDIYSRPGAGTAILARLSPGGLDLKSPPLLTSGAVSLPKAGEEACGDGWSVRRDADGLTAMVVDGLGHGPLAATAANAAIRAFETYPSPPTTELVQRLHETLRSTRGAAASIMRLPGEGDVEFIGVGNVLGMLVAQGEGRRMVAYNGTLGHSVKSVRPFSYAAGAEALVVLASDGLGTSWSLDAYPGLRQRHPTLIAAVLYRDFSRGRDDVTVLVCRREAA